MASDDGVISDLMVKVAKDVTATIIRTIAICPRPHLPVVTAAVAAALGTMAAELDKLDGGERMSGPDPDNVLLGALIAAHHGIETVDPTGAAYKSFAALEAAGLTPGTKARGETP